MKKTVVLYALFFSLTGACSKSSGRKGDSAPRPSPSPEDAVARLSPEHRQNFDSWKASLVKGCSARHAFTDVSLKDLESENGPMVGLDAALMLNANSGSLVYSEGESTAILDSYDTSYVEEENSYNQSLNFNGQSYILEAKAKRSGLGCEVFLSGQKVYETKIARSFNVGFGLGDKTSPTLVESKRKPSVNPIGLIGLGELKSPDLSSALAAELAPIPSSRDLVAKKLEIPESLAKKVLTLGNRGQGTMSLAVVSGSPLWTSAHEKSIVDTLSHLKSIESDGSTSLSLEARLDLIRIQVGESISSKDAGTYKVYLNAEISKKEDTFTTKIVSVDPKGVSPQNDAEARDCLVYRSFGLKGNPASNNIIVPGVEELLGPCQLFHDNLVEYAQSSGTFQSLTPSLLERVRPSLDFRYNGWDRVLTDLALKALEENKDLNAEFDPKGITVVVPRLAANISQIKTPLEQSKNLVSEKNAVLSMAMSWAFRGIELSISALERTIGALDNTVSPFKVSTLELMRDLGKSSMSPTQQDYAFSIDDSFKAQAVQALSLSKELGYTGFERLFDKVLQVQVSLEEMRLWPERLTEIKSALSPLAGLSSIKDRLIGDSIYWLQTKSVEYRDLPQVYNSLSNVADTFPESTKALLAAMKNGPKGEQESLNYSAQMTQAMKDLGVSIRDRSVSLDLNSFGEGFFSTILQKRPSEADLRSLHDTLVLSQEFKNQESARLSGFPNQVSKNNQNLKELLALAVKELWSKQDFEDTVKLADLGREKKNFICADYRGVSSIIDCYANGLVSKARGKLLDPSFNSRYGQLAVVFKGYLPDLRKKTTFTADEMLSEFFNSSGPLWNRCDASAFAEKVKSVDQTMGLLAKETSRIKILDLERALKDGFENCP